VMVTQKQAKTKKLQAVQVMCIPFCRKWC